MMGLVSVFEYLEKRCTNINVLLVGWESDESVFVERETSQKAHFPFRIDF